MKKIFRRKRTWLIILLLLIAAPIVFGYVMMNSFSWSDKEIAEYFKTKSMKPQFNTYQVNGRAVFYASIGADTLPMVLFIHGAPGSWYDYIKYFGDSNLIQHAHLVALDRPGYGKSGEGKPVTSIEEQAEMIRPLLDLNKSKKHTILVGHSYGGPIAVELAMDNSEVVKAMILLAPQIDPGNEKQFAINKLGNFKVIQRVMPKMWLTAYWEKRTHVDELKKMHDKWNKISTPTVYMFGDKDGIVPPVNAQYAKRMMTNAPMEMIEFPNENHFIPWTQQDSVTRVILKMISQ
ncbi:MAG TPA: alpha/beta hydrolase [Chitinophagales bacterium]|nr:alpha/beta hydrolase [Chitinophagales bacterium]